MSPTNLMEFKKEDNDFLIYRCSTQEEQERRAFTVPVLILDDIGRETGTDLKKKLETAKKLWG